MHGQPGVCAVQAPGWLKEFKELEAKLKEAAGEAAQLQHSVQQRNSESDYKPIADALTGMLMSLNQEVKRAM